MTTLPPAAPILRPVTAADVADVLAINEANVELLAPLDAERLGQLQEWAHRCDVIEVDGGFGGFVVTVCSGSAYDSDNYRWFAERYETFLYLDRIVLAPHVRRRGVGARVYDALEAEAAPFGRMLLEVNADPPNVASLAFHHGRGYVEVGTKTVGEDAHLVSLLGKELAAPQG